MPSNFDAALTEGEFRDLLGYLLDSAAEVTRVGTGNGHCPTCGPGADNAVVGVPPRN